MRDKRPVDELSIEELERILAIRKREARQARLRGYQGSGRIVAPKLDPDEAPSAVDSAVDPVVLPAETARPSAKATPSPAPQPASQPAPPPPPAPLPETYYDDAPRFEDELDRSRQPVQPVNRRVLRARVWNRTLMFVEFAAVIGLVVVFVGLYQSLQSVTQVSADMQAQFEATANARLVPPTPTPVININSVVLPVGHTVTLGSNGVVTASFNLDEVPAQYRDQYVALMSQPQAEPTSSPQGPVRLQIPALKLDSTVVEGDNWASLQLGVGHHIGSANPGERGNMVLSGHDDVYGEVFKNIDKLKPGDQVTVISTIRAYTYVVQESRIVSPTDVWVLDSRGDQKQLTLITCYPYRVDSKRIVIFATLQASQNQS